MHPFSRSKTFFAGAAAALALSPPLGAQDSGVIELEPYAVKGETGPLFEEPVVGNLSFVTGEELEGINAVDVEDSLKYLPNFHVRKRFIGDANGVTSIRGQHTWMTGRSLVTVDGILLSNFLQTRWAGAPRWGAVAPEEVQYAEVQYGPYSAFNSGNALGGAVNIVTRMPETRRSRFKTSVFAQNFGLYGADDTHLGYKLFASHGDRFGKLSLFAFYSRLENDSHPQDFGETVELSAAEGSEPEAFGAFRDKDPRGRDRLVYGSSGSESVVRDQLKLKARYDFTEKIQGQASVVFVNNETERADAETFLVDSEGDPVWSGERRVGDTAFSVTPGDFGASLRDRQDILAGFTLGGELAPGWNFDSTLSFFNVIEDESRDSFRNPRDPLDDGSGRVSWFEDTNWLTFDVKAGSDALFGLQGTSLYAGYRFADYNLELRQADSEDWRAGTRDALRNATGGQSGSHALYAQASQKLGERWTATLGARQEWWRASDGFVEDPSGIAFHPERDEARFSPKFALEFQPSSRWKATFNLAQAYRFPLVPELFQGRVGTDGSVDRSEPGLEPEDALAAELSLVRLSEGGQMRLTYFRDEVEDAIFNLLDVNRDFSLFLNIDEVATEGFEFVLDRRSFLADGLDFRFSASYTDSVIERNAANPALEGNRFPRIPRWRVNGFATWHLDRRWSASLGARYQSHSFNRLENDDPLGGFGSVSEFLVFDAKLVRRWDNGVSVSAGIDNLFDEEYFSFHPFPQRTFFLEASFEL